MKDFITLVAGIEYKTREMIGRLQTAQNKNVNLEEKNKELTLEIEELRTRIKQLEYNNQIIKTAKALEGNKGSTNAKLMINGLLREIDRTIGLLND